MLNDRQKRLYKFLLDKSSANEFITKEEICTSLKELYPRYLEKTNEHSSSAYSMIRKDVRAINGSDKHKIIASNRDGYKIATRKEANEYIRKRFRRDLKSLKINWNLKDKVGKNGQYHIADEEIKEIKTFIEGDRNG